MSSAQSTQRSNGVTHRRCASVVHECLRASANVGQTGIGATLTASHVGKLADIVPTRNRAIIRLFGFERGELAPVWDEGASGLRCDPTIK